MTPTSNTETGNREYSPSPHLLRKQLQNQDKSLQTVALTRYSEYCQEIGANKTKEETLSEAGK